ncbi:hypothetical protein B5J94_01300 [Moraxella lacunata]|uniref:Uncharacterized protein n=1 Tax=Moraxella lacunata TaxID=477 RepID=A0A1V4H2U2_MORLA|nr:hypothetical protein B5J94_01300 [Moraxella lacunata]
MGFRYIDRLFFAHLCQKEHSSTMPQNLGVFGDFYTQKYSTNPTSAINTDTTCPHHDLFCP